MHPFKLSIDGFQLSLYVIRVRHCIQGQQRFLEMVLGINQQAAIGTSRFVAHKICYVLTHLA